MKRKSSGRMTKRLVSVLAASALITAQIPEPLIAGAEYNAPAAKAQIDSLSDTDILDVTFEENRKNGNDISLQTETADSSTESTSLTSITATAITSTTTAIPEEEKIQPDPELSCSKLVISADKAGSTVPVNLYINDKAFDDEMYYNSAEIYFNFDYRLEYQSCESGTENGTSEMDVYGREDTPYPYRKNCRVTANMKNGLGGRNGVFATVNFKVPADAKPGDIYYFNICPYDGYTHNIYYSNPKVTRSYDSKICHTADNSDDEYLKGTHYDGYILIDPKSTPALDAPAKKYDTVIKDMILYNVYSDHAEVVSCDYQAENAVIQSEINGKKVTSVYDYAFENTNIKSVVIPDSIKTLGTSAFSECKSLKKVVLPNSLETLPDYLFSGCISLSEAELPENVTSIGIGAFKNTSLSSVKIPDSVTFLGENAFSGCKQLASVKLSSALTSLEEGVFEECVSLESIELPDGLTSIGDRAFYKTMIKEIKIPESVTILGERCFAETQIESFKISKNVTEINYGVFMDCDKLTSVDLGSKITSLPDMAFYGCTSLKDINIPDSVTSLGSQCLSKTQIESFKISENVTEINYGVFMDCDKLTSVDLGSKITVINYSVFSGCSSLKSLDIPDSVTLICGEAFSGSGITELKIPSSVKNLTSDAFEGSNITSIIYPDDIKVLPQNAFGSASKMEKVKIPSSVTALPTQVFVGCSALTSFEIPSNITSIGSYAFQDSSIKELKVPSTVKNLDKYAFARSALETVVFEGENTPLSYGIFSEDTALKSVKLPSELAVVPCSSFKGCKSLVSIDIPDSVTYLDSEVFNDCTSLAEVKMPASLNSISYNTFANCSALKSLELPEGLLAISNSAFEASGIKELRIPDSVNNISENAFRGSNIEVITYSDELTELPGNAYSGASNMKTVKLPSKLTAIPDRVFEGCSSLETVELSDNIKSIGISAFSESGVKELKLPSSVDTIKEGAFAFSNLEYVEIDDNVTTLPYGLFNNAIKLRSVKLPSACKNIPPKGFTNCTSLESIELPDTLERIGSYAFENSGIKSLEIPDSVAEIGSNAFENADKLESITLPSGLKKIDSNFFAGCTSLKKIILPENVNDICSYAFSGCTNLTELELPEGLLRIGESAFSGCGIGELKIPDSVNSLTNPFRGSNIKNIIYSDTRTELPMNAYSGASKLESVKLPSKLTAIPDHAFTDCISLEKVDIPSSVNKIGKYAFNNCGIKELNLSGNNIETIENHAFERARLEYVELPDTVTVIEDSTFLKCNSLTQIQLPAALTTIGTSAFSNCASLKEIEIPDTVTSIGNAAFGNCVKLESIELPESLTALNTNLFMNCMELKDVKLPNGIDSINYGTFSGCSSLESITLPDSLTSIGTKAFESSGLTSLCIPASVKTIDNSAFLNSNIDTIYGYAGSIAETVAEKNGFKFVGLEEKTWNEKGSLPTSGIYKLECDVTVDNKISISSFLDLDLNGHNVVVKGMNVSGDMTIRDSSKDKTGSISSSDSGVLFNVDGILKLMGGTLTGNDNNSSVVDLKAKSRFILDGGKIISYSGYSLSIDTGKASVDLISGSVEAVDKNIAKPDFNRSAVYIKEGYSGTLKLDGAVINADNGFGIYSESYDGTLDITGGSISSKKYYGIYCLKGTKTAVSGKINISGDAAGIYIAENQIIDVKGSLADSKIIINAAKTSIITNGYAEFNEGIDPTTIFMAVKGEKISLDKSGEVFCEVPVHSEHGDAETTTTTFAATSTTTTTTSTTSMTTASSTSSSTTSSSTTSTTTTGKNASAVIIPETLTESVPPPPHRLDIQGDMTVKEMSLADLKKAGINLEDASNYHVFEYDLEMKFEAKTVHIKKFDIIGGTDYIDAPPIHNGSGRERPNGSGRLQPVVTIDDKPAKVIDYVETEKEEMYMVISGECKWLKEFFDVQLIVINKDSSHESLTGCSATLNVPDGLSLVNCENTQNIGVLASNSAYTVNWYVRGDKAGDYALTADFKGKNQGEEYNYNFKSKNNLHVYADDALKMKIILPKYSFFDEDYLVTISFENVSDKPIYNIEHKINGVVQSQQKNKYKNGVLVEEGINKELYSEDFDNTTISTGQLDPGEKIVATVAIKDIWKSIAEKNMDNSKIALDCVSLLTCIKTNPVLFGIGAVAKAANSILNCFVVAHALECVDVATLPGSTVTIPYEVEVVDISDAMKDKYGKSILEELSFSILGTEIDIAQNPDAGDLYNRLMYVRELTSAGASPVDLAFSSASYIASIKSDFASGLITVGRDLYYRYHKPEGKASVTFCIMGADGSIQYAPGLFAKTVERSVYDEFDVEVINGEYTVKENGDIILTSDAIIKVTPKRAGTKATIALIADDGEELGKIPVAVVDEHECKGESYIITPPSDGRGAGSVTFCDVCGGLVDCSFLPLEATAMLSNGECYQDIRGAIDDYKNYDEKLKLYLFGDITIDEDITVPDDLTLIITPETKITFKNGSGFITKGEVNDFSGYDYDLSGNGTIVTTTSSVTESTTTTTETTTSTTETTENSTTTSTEETTTAALSSETTTVTTEKTENLQFFAPISKWGTLASDDYKAKNDTVPAATKIKDNFDGTYSIFLSDEKGNVIDVYTIDPSNGKGKNSAGEIVELPQTGNNSITNILITIVSFMLIILGFSAVKLSGFKRRRKN